MSHQGYDPGSRRPSHSSSHPPGWNASSNSGPSNGSYTDTPHGDAAVIAQCVSYPSSFRSHDADSSRPSRSYDINMLISSNAAMTSMHGHNETPMTSMHGHNETSMTD